MFDFIILIYIVRWTQNTVNKDDRKKEMFDNVGPTWWCFWRYSNFKKYLSNIIIYPQAA